MRVGSMTIAPRVYAATREKKSTTKKGCVWTRGTSLMKFTIKTLQHEEVVVELEATNVVSMLKQAMCTPARDGWRSAETVKIVCNGKVLADTDSLSAAADYLNAAPHRFLVAIVRSGKLPVPKKAGGAPPDISDAAAAPFAACNEEACKEEAPSAATMQSTSSDGSDAAALAQLTDMGFDGAAATAALAATEGNVLRAVDALTRGAIPAAAAPARALGRAAAERLGPSGVQRLAQAARANAIARGLATDDRQLAMLERMPEVQRLLGMPRLAGIRARPEELQKLLRALLLRPTLQQHVKAGTVTEEMLDDVLRDPEEHAAAAGDGNAPDAASPGVSGAAGGPAAAAGAERLFSQAERQRRLRSEHAGGALEAQLRGSDDEAALARLVALGGFSRARVLEAYLACERDEALAASLLFSQADDA